MASNLDTTVTVFGGSGFLGRNVVRALCKRDYRVRVAVRRPELAGHLQPLGRVGQIHAVQANVRYPASVEAAMRDSQVAINLVGILAEGGGQSFDAVQVKGAETIAKAAAANGGRMVHVSAIGADENSLSGYFRAKAEGEKAVQAALPSATIMRPSLLFGPEDQFTNRFAALARISPVLPLVGGGVNTVQPAYVADVADAVADAVDGKAKPGATYELIVDRSVKAGDIVRAAQNVDKKLITDVTVFDVYEGKGIDSDKKSIAIAVTIQPREKTMTDQEIDALAGKITAEVAKRTGGVLRA